MSMNFHRVRRVTEENENNKFASSETLNQCHSQLNMMNFPLPSKQPSRPDRILFTAGLTHQAIIKVFKN